VVAVLAGCEPPNPLISIPVRKGLIWLLFATVAEVPSTVILAICFAPFHFSHHYFTLLQVLVLLNLNGRFLTIKGWR
jgi:hypothetical protein